MRHGEGFDDEVLDFEAAAGLHQPPLRCPAEFQAAEQVFLGEGGAVERHAQPAAEHFQAGGVILVLVGEQDAVERSRCDASRFQSQADLLGAEAGVDE